MKSYTKPVWIHSSVLSLQFLDVLSAMIYRYKGLKNKASPFHTKKSSNYTLLPVLAIYNCKYPRGWAHSSEVVNWYMCESVNAFCNFLVILNEKWKYKFSYLYISYYYFKLIQFSILNIFSAWGLSEGILALSYANLTF